MTAKLLAIENLRVGLVARNRMQPILRGVSLQVATGEVHGLIGESGAGKSMIARAILGLLPRAARVIAGSVRFDGEDLLTLDAARRRALLGRAIALIPQDPATALNPLRPVGRQITEVLTHRLGHGRAAAAARMLALLEDVSIREPTRVARQYPHELSGGMRQRILIAMAFAGAPRLVVADEPTTALDVTVQRTILRLIRDMMDRHGGAVLFVTHDLGIVAKLCRTMSVLHAGRVLEQGAVAGILAAPRHRYTRALLSATPRFDRPAAALEPISPTLLAALWEEARAEDRATMAP